MKVSSFIRSEVKMSQAGKLLIRWSKTQQRLLFFNSVSSRPFTIKKNQVEYD